MIGDIIVVVICLGLIFLFRELDKQNNSLAKVKKFSDKVMADIGEYFKSQSASIKNSSIELDVKQSQAVAAVKRLEENTVKFNSRNTEITQKIELVNELEKRLNSYDVSLKDLIEMTANVEENLDRVRKYSNFVSKISQKIDSYDKQINLIEKSIPNIITNISTQNEEKMNVVCSDFHSWVDKRTADLQALANDSVDKNELLLDEIKNLYEKSIQSAESNANTVEQELYDRLYSEITQRAERFEESLTRSTQDLKEFAEQEQKLVKHNVETVLLNMSAQLDSIDRTFETKKDETQTIIGNFEESMREKLSSLENIVDTNIGTIKNKLDSDMEKSYSVLQNDIQNNAADQKESFIQQLLDNLAKLTSLQEELIEEKIREKQESVNDLLHKITSDFNENLFNTNEQLEMNLTDANNLLESKISNLKEQTISRIEKQESEIAQQEQNLAIVTKKSEAAEVRINSVYETFESRINEVADKTNAEITKQLETMEEFDANFEKMKKFVAEIDASVLEKQNSTQQTIDGLQDMIDTSATAFTVTLENRYSDLRTLLENRIGDINSELAAMQKQVIKDNNQKSIDFFASLEDQINSVKNDVEYKLEKINTVGNDVDRLEENLRRLMQVAENNVYSDFETFKDETKKTQDNFEKETKTAYAVIKTMLETIDTELNQLKTVASQNVSEKLNLFESDFYADLAKRGNGISDELLSWKHSFDEKINDLGSHLDLETQTIEKSFSDSMKSNLATLQQHYKEQIDKIEERFTTTEDQYSTYVKNLESTIHYFIESQTEEVEKAKAIANEQFASDFGTHRESVLEKLKRFERDIENNIVQIDQSVNAVQEETSASLEGLRSNITSWRERLDNQFQENKDIYSEKFDSLQRNAAVRLEQIEQIFASDVEKFATLAKGEKDAIASDIDNLKVDAKKSIGYYETRSSEMVDEFKKSYEAMLQETQMRITGENSESEKKLRDLRNLVQEVKQESEEMQENIVLKIQTEANQLKMNVDTIDSQLQHFTAQTNLIEKAELMRVELENQMTEIRSQLNRFDNFKQVTDRIEGQLAKIRNLDDETISRMEKIDAERSRLDSLESDFNELILLSNSMEQKISDLKTNSDDLQLFQVEVKRYKENLEAVSTRYERFEKKNEVLDQTMKDVDRIFESLRDLEIRLDSCKKDTETIPAAVSSVRADITELLSNSRSINDVMTRLNDLDSKLADIKGHVENVQKARDMMIKIETRLTEITADAKDQINLYKTVKAGGKREPGAPPIAVRENVIKLARQGWTSEQIADSLKLARGEVELILDFHSGEIH